MQGVVDINSLNPRQSTFPEKDILAPAAAKLAAGMKLSDLGKALPAFKRMTDRHVRATKKQISGHVIRVDSFGNLITNIPKEAFEMLSKDRTYTLQLNKEIFKRLYDNYHQVEPGEALILFNSLGLLEIAVNMGHAADLFGAGYDSAVIINFDE
ncbi:MAG TPA: SAM-dependent chlorinase/fluorinase [Cyclobacteriaceae bacterium]|nr:SAM-dependent chlorinase/fluorinase [Cyclobacteriaceae bacterium]